MKFQGAVCVITGGSSGLGKATVKRLLELGTKIMIFDLQEPNNQLYLRNKDNLSYQKVDITDTKQEAIRTARIVFNDNSIHFLNYGQPNRYKSTHEKIGYFKEFMMTVLLVYLRLDNNNGSSVSPPLPMVVIRKLLEYAIYKSSGTDDAGRYLPLERGVKAYWEMFEIPEDRRKKVAAPEPEGVPLGAAEFDGA